ncbi:hypothetical protein [Lewinella sp. W8]|uniref:hypothetical protein n=1 Tax=Lewinella sp. W8 TaxID=2528208 RepID=UPI0010677A12|nr:hypothetical protein [Lewinella sp. W8]MTB53038.1 hypothetical protein [Lewinella sp. W8]
MECLEQLVGLTASACECLNAEEGFDPSESVTGMTLTDEVGGFPLLDRVTASIDCNDPGNIIDKLKAARSEGARQFVLDVARATRKRYHAANQFNGSVGRKKVKSTYVLPSGMDAAGLELRFPLRKGQSFVLDAVYTLFPSAGDFSLTVWSNDPTFTTKTIEVTNSVAGQPHKTDLSSGQIVLPWFSRAMVGEPYIVYRIFRSDGANPSKNEITCCGFVPEHEKHFSAKGFNSSAAKATSEFDCIGSSSYAMGLSLEGFTTCDVTGWLCETKQIGEYDLQDAIGQAIRYAGAINLANTVLHSSKINAYTLLGQEGIYRLRSSYRKSYGEMVEWIGANVPATALDCLGCRRKVIQSTVKSLN